MVSTNQRSHIRIGTNLIGNIYSQDNAKSIIFVENISAIGAKIKSDDRHLEIGQIFKINFKYKNILYDISCKIVRKDENSKYGVQFYFSDNSDKINPKMNKLHQHILDEYFLNRRAI